MSQAPAPQSAPAQESAETLRAVMPLLQEAQSLQNRKRYVDALFKLDEAHRLAPNDPHVYNMRGAVYLALPLRDEAIARELFLKARDLMPDVLPPYFNLAEVDFVMNHWEAAEKGFREVLVRFPKTEAGVRHLIVFKQIICLAKLDKVDDAQRLADQTFTLLDDTPAYYFARAVIARHRGLQQESNDFLTKAQVIYKPAATTTYIDSMTEAGYISPLAALTASVQTR